MIVIHNPSEFHLSGSAVSIGMFDGVHRGHRRVLRTLRDQGRVLQLPTVLVTFDPHPLATLRPESCPPLLSTLEGRMDLLASTGHVDYCLVLKFDRQRSGESTDDFVRGTLVDKLGMRSLIVGENFACGSGRQGNITYLGNLGGCLGFDVRPVPLRLNTYIENGAYCSSSETRRLVQQGDIGGANAMLDRPHELSGTVFGPSDSACRVIDLLVPGDLCSPPMGDYAGTVKKQHVAAPWIDAILQVREQHSQIGARTVRLLVEKDTQIALGDAMTVRFHDRARSATSRFAFSTMALT
ncbi:FMN adenylyltransferase [Paraburkholderia ginsengiterrae]|uniref:FAD synthase n=1 Tax=Paraburkholderia ginsengiterrae TaxID=1462993 RepID=A0A1A9N7Y7_9BURK|nr:FAD synthetase family protein [Paraburkholderia ginsengiterrae]OAJ56020.1 FMN adenylyltransferase [Paraburkholderia ginsengiterrae]OAJ61549.1 FMN adenylyltransferase [Paraburkholderia ginsengiterrae]